jgi:Fic family protein
MKVPVAPPHLPTLLGRVAKKRPERLLEIVGAAGGAAPDGRYRHWDTLRHVPPPKGLSSEEWWMGVKLARLQLYQQLPFTTREGRPFRYALVAPVHRMLHYVTKNASGAIRVDEVVTDPGTRDTYLVKSLVEEAITSSQLEGASTTRAAAKEMLQRGRKPRDRSERMIFNNYRAMEFVRTVGDTPLRSSVVLELHRLLTEGTLDDPTAAGRLRRPDEDVVVADSFGVRLHTPPPADMLLGRLESLCAFANSYGEDEQETFLDPVLRAILLHFWLAYDHPFVDGNGRTARALFYWSLAVQGYWLAEFISISRVLKKAPARYAEAFLYVETDDDDVTYFLLHQLRVIERAIRALHEYLVIKERETRETEQLLRGSHLATAAFNNRQLALLGHALKHQGFSYTFASHSRSHRVTYQTARTDLLALERAGLVERLVRGRTFVFVAPRDLRRRLDGLGQR